MSAATTPLRDVDDAPPRERVRVQGMALPFDVVLLVAVAGLAACSLLAIKSSTADDIAGDPTYYFKRPAPDLREEVTAAQKRRYYAQLGHPLPAAEEVPG